MAFIQQLQSQYLTDDMADQIIKNLIFISKVAKLVAEITAQEKADEVPEADGEKSTEQEEDEEGSEADGEKSTEQEEDEEGLEADGEETTVTGQKRLSLPWLVRKLVREATHECMNNRKVTLKVSHYGYTTGTT